MVLSRSSSNCANAGRRLQLLKNGILNASLCVWSVLVPLQLRYVFCSI